MFKYDVNVPLVQVMGLTAPEQKEFNFKPDTVGFDQYTDFIGDRIFDSSWAGDGSNDFYFQDLEYAKSYI